MNNRTNLAGFASCLILLTSLVGCGGSNVQSSIEPDDLESYLDEHPELRDLEYVDPTSDIGSASN